MWLFSLALNESQLKKILGWCPAGSSLMSRGECASLALIGHLSHDIVTLKIAFKVDF